VDYAYPENDGTSVASVWATDVFGTPASPSFRFFNKNSAGTARNVAAFSNDGGFGLGAGATDPTVTPNAGVTLRPNGVIWVGNNAGGFPEAVTTNGDNGETPLKDQAHPWSVDYGRVTPLIVKAVQELKGLFDADHGEIVRLKADNDNLRGEMNTLLSRTSALVAQNGALVSSTLELKAANDDLAHRLECLEKKSAAR
jgi:hypothetical protein